MQALLTTLLFVAPDWVVSLTRERRPNAFWAEYIVWPVIQIVLVVFIVLTLVAYLTYLERKVSALIQARLGPMRVGPWGLLQPLADGIKLLIKEDIVPIKADRAVFLIAPVISVVAALVVLSVIPWGAGWATIANVNIGVLFILAVSSVGVLVLVLAGWSSNSKYSLLGALRSSAQMVSYEIGMGLSIIGALMFARTLSMSGIIDAQQTDSLWGLGYFLYQPLGVLVYLTSALGETNRAPFDLPEAESELVAGFHTEYASFKFAMFFIAEYTSMITVSCLCAILFFGGWLSPFPANWTWTYYLPTVLLLPAGLWVIWDGLRYETIFGKVILPGIGAVMCILAIALVIFPGANNYIQAPFWLLSKIFVFLFVYVWMRGTLPRLRYDQLMAFGWKMLLPVSIANVVITSFVILRWGTIK